MSYILEALKKSDQERQKKQIPDLQTNHAPFYPGAGRSRRKKRSPVTLPLISGLILVIAVATLFVFSDKSPLSFRLNVTINEDSKKQNIKHETQEVLKVNEAQESFKVPPVEETAHVEAEPPQNTVEQTVQLPAPAVIEKPAPVVIENNQDQTPQEKVIYEPMPLIAENSQPEVIIEIPATQPDVPFLSELPVELQDMLPKLSYAGHAYSVTPEERMIIINNSIRREGEKIAPDLRLTEITWEGVIFKFKGTKFQVVTTR